MLKIKKLLTKTCHVIDVVGERVATRAAMPADGVGRPHRAGPRLQRCTQGHLGFIQWQSAL